MIEIEKMRLTKNEVRAVIIKHLNAKKAQGYDLIIDLILKKPELRLTYLIQLFNAILRAGYFPPQWKVTRIIMIPKPNRNPMDVRSYSPISLLSILLKLFEKLLF